jgi:protein gp37
MSDRSHIEWTDATWNPVRGCTKVSPGCKQCYAAVFAERWRGVKGHPYEQGFDLKLVPDKLLDPLEWARSRTVFVNSMSDLFQEGVPEEFIFDVFRIMRLADWHVYQVLTKRADRMQKLLSTQQSCVEKLNHVWLGVSVEDRRFGVPRIDQLRATPASVRFLSIEPLLEDLGELDLRGIDWVIVGGESGPGCRPMEPAWVHSIKAQCRRSQVPFFFKQWGGVRKSRNGRELDGRVYDEFPALRELAVPDHDERKKRLAAARAAVSIAAT